MRTAVVTKCSDENFWYSELVGFPELAQFKIIGETKEGYIVKQRNGFYWVHLLILKEDCLIIEK